MKRKLEHNFAGINFVHSGRQCFAHSESREVVKQLLATKKELGDLKVSSGTEKLVTKYALSIQDMIKKTSVNLPWPLKLLDLLYTVLFNRGIKSITNKSERLKQ